MTIHRIPDITIMIPAIDSDQHDFSWFNERFGKAISQEILVYLYQYACNSEESKYYTLVAFVEMIGAKKAKFVRTEMVIE